MEWALRAGTGLAAPEHGFVLRLVPEGREGVGVTEDREVAPRSLLGGAP